MPHILGLGALYEDVVLTVPTFPTEDSKLRASNRITRIGGNIINTFEVLNNAPKVLGTAPRLDSRFCGAVGSRKSCQWIEDDLYKRNISTCSHLVFREEVSGPSSAFILCSENNGSRTIISHANGIADVSTTELCELFISEDRNGSCSNPDPEEDPWPEWIHVEGRNCEAVARFLREARQAGFKGVVSLDCERPRDGLEDLIAEADILFISETYAAAVTASKYTLAPTLNDHSALLRAMLCALGPSTRADASGYLMLGSSGCYAFAREQSDQGSRGDVIERLQQTSKAGMMSVCVKSGVQFVYAKVEALSLTNEEVVETVGAGDTFIAGVIWGSLHTTSDWLRKARLAVILASVKCTRKGFKGIWADARFTDAYQEL